MIRKHVCAVLIAGAVLFNFVNPVFACSLNINADLTVFKGRYSVDPIQISLGYDHVRQKSLDRNREDLFIEFRNKVTNGEASRIMFFFVPDIGGFYVLQQPSSQDGIVSPVEGVLTQFRRPASQGVIGLMAHNYSAGKWFSRFSVGDEFFIIYGDGRVEAFQYKEAIRYRAINGKNVLSDFVDLSNGERESVDQVYERVYSGKPHLTLQTCIQEKDDLTWGRLFIVAVPIR